MVSEDEISFDSCFSKSVLGKGKHIRDSVLPSKQRNNAFLSLSLVCVLGKQGNPKNCIQNQGSIINLQGFAAIWHLTFWLHGDLEPENLAKREDKEYTPCVSQIHDFTSTFLFSVETQHTIGIVVEIGKCLHLSGYGSRGSTNECWDTVLLQCIQSIVGVIIQVPIFHPG